MRDVRLIKRHTHDKGGCFMKLNLSVETSQPCGKKFRLAFGITVPLVLIGMVLTLLGLS